MELCDINPHLRFAAVMRYVPSFNNKPVKVTDSRIFYITEGQALLHIHGQCCRLQPHSLFYCCAGSEYTLAAQGDFSLICLNFDLSQRYREHTIPLPISDVTEDWEQFPVYFDEVTDSPFLNRYLHLPNASGLYSRLQNIVSEYTGGAWLGRVQSQVNLKLLLVEMHRLSRDQLPPKIAWVIDYIRQHFAETITNRQLADMVGYHEYHLNRIFIACTGQSLHSFLLQVRLTHAAYLILNTDRELQQISELVGFGSYPHFSGYFKQTYGYSPAQYRKRMRNSI